MSHLAATHCTFHELKANRRASAIREERVVVAVCNCITFLDGRSGKSASKCTLKEGYRFKGKTNNKVPLIHRSSKILIRLSKTMHSAASLRKKERLSPSPCMHTASIWGEGKFCLNREVSKNTPYK